MARHSVDRSTNALGLGFNQWTLNDLSVILNHYGVGLAIEDSKKTVIDKLNQLALERGLTRVDRLAIVKAHKAGRSLPPRKPLVRDLIVRPTDPQTATTPLTVLHAKEYSSAANDGSDTDMSDEEDTEELPSLSEEERDLREYTSTMSMPRSSGRHRMVRSRATASKAGNHPLRVNRPMMEDRLAIINGRVSIRRSAPVAINRTGAMIHPTSNQHARPRTAKAAPTTTQPRNDPSSPQVTQAMNYECDICYGSFDPVKTSMRQPTSSCTHEINICKSCLSASISSQIETKLWTRIGCPASACNKLMGYDDVREFAEPQMFARYFEFTFQAAQAGSHFQRCRTSGCVSGQQCFPEDTIMNCQECHHKTCITCDTEMHPGISCREKAAEREAAQQNHELATTGYLKTQAKTCPECEAPSQKTGGCDHMTCKQCGHEYCWRCLADYGPINEEGNHHHEPTCRYHSNNL